MKQAYAKERQASGTLRPLELFNNYVTPRGCVVRIETGLSLW